MFLFHVQNGQYNSFFFSENGEKTVKHYATEEDYNNDIFTDTTLKYDGVVYDNLQKYYIFTSGYCLKVGDNEILLVENNELNTNPLDDILKESVDVTSYHTGYNIRVPYCDRLSYGLDVYTVDGKKVNVFSSMRGQPFVGQPYDNSSRLTGSISFPTSGVLKDKPTINLQWGNNTYVKSDNSFSSNLTSGGWGYLYNLRPIYIIVKPKKPNVQSEAFKKLFDSDDYNKSYFVRW